MNSSLYKCKIMHKRLRPKPRQFFYTLFMLSVDLDELPQLHKKLKWFSYNKANIYSLQDKDYASGHTDLNIKEKLFLHLKGIGIQTDTINKVILQTMPRAFGYQFNPVSFYYLYDKVGQCIGCLTEVTNTFLEKKLYYISEFGDSEWLELKTAKEFYVSPFSKVDDFFQFKIGPADKKWSVNINDYDDEGIVLISTIRAQKHKLTDGVLLLYLLRFPCITLQVITMIHWHALVLLLKRFPVTNKAKTKEQQTSVLRPHKSIHQKR